MSQGKGEMTEAARHLLPQQRVEEETETTGSLLAQGKDRSE